MSQPLHVTRPEKEILEIGERIEEQRTRLERIIVQGAPTQAAEDRLRELQQILLQMTGHHRLMHN